MAKRKAKRRSSSTSKKVSVKSTNSSNSGYVCSCCGGDYQGLGWVIFIIGILYLLSDLGWMSWWNISWFTILFLIFGLKMIRK